jgi:hypothetical protein
MRRPRSAWMRLHGLERRLVLALRSRLMRLRLQVSLGIFFCEHMLLTLFSRIDLHALESSTVLDHLDAFRAHALCIPCSYCNERRRESAEVSELRGHMLSKLVPKFELCTFESKRGILHALGAFLAHASRSILCNEQPHFASRPKKNLLIQRSFPRALRVALQQADVLQSHLILSQRQTRPSRLFMRLSRPLRSLLLRLEL